ncbi:type II secretion system protein E [Mycoplasma sp. CAG:877]|nr:type II secretion system protein E [Mycoplasma sp. CAG:877]
MVEEQTKKAVKKAETNMVAFDFERTPITQIADYIIITASKNNTSDIHFDPREDGMMVRFRIDGDLQDYTHIPKAFERNLTTRLKILANMNITESRLPQDGAIKGEFGGKYLDMRVSCLPLNEGEKIVIRILDYTRSLQGIDSLGFNPANLVKLKRMMGVPNGIILVTGATGSGKSTTVYSILQGLNKPEINIITVEDPIEMNIEGMNQVQVNAEIGMTFAAALRSILRQDPNVILIGEIRDSETAQIAVRASITGHLVLSTIHTNNSLSTIERLLDMDVERYLLSTALTGIISQRLAKQLCIKCRVERETTKYEKKVFKKFMNKDVEKIYDANPEGCKACRKGYKGRIAIQEVLELDEEIRNALNDTKLSKEQLSDMVYTNKTITMLQDALGKCIAGLTSFEEVYRVIEIESDPDDDSTGSSLTKSIDDENILDSAIPKTEENKEKEKEEEKETVPENKPKVEEVKIEKKEEVKEKEQEVIITPPTIKEPIPNIVPEKPKVEEIKGQEVKSSTTQVITPPVPKQQAVNIDKNPTIPIVKPETIAKQTAPITKEMPVIIPNQVKPVTPQQPIIPNIQQKQSTIPNNKVLEPITINKPILQPQSLITDSKQPVMQNAKQIQQVQPVTKNTKPTLVQSTSQTPVLVNNQKIVQPTNQAISQQAKPVIQNIKPVGQIVNQTPSLVNNQKTVQPVGQVTPSIKQTQPIGQIPIKQVQQVTKQQVKPVATVQLPKLGETQ